MLHVFKSERFYQSTPPKKEILERGGILERGF
ncbi:hypothetical protein N198_01280 [Helicobacter pylori UM037]|uniref:Uncharacterized protein n=1 Tax=Helicobacter pylori UM037 TaxID=1321939 RepID=A0AB33Z7A4_HELPX|nr:hypothetical protein N198_01280 [Helicobacter pylori UM037]